MIVIPMRPGLTIMTTFNSFRNCELEKVKPIPILNLPSITFPNSSLPFTINKAFLVSLGRVLYSPPCIPARIRWILVNSGHSGGMEFWQCCLPKL